MSTVMWGEVLTNVTPNAGSSPLDPGEYNFKVVLGKGAKASTGALMISVHMEVTGGADAGRKTWHNWVMPKENDDKAQTRMSYFLGDMEALGLTKEWFVTTLGGHPISEETCNYIAGQLVGREAAGSVTVQKTDTSRRNINNFRAVDPALNAVVPKAATFNPAAAAPIPQAAPQAQPMPQTQLMPAAPTMPQVQQPQTFAPAAHPPMQFQFAPAMPQVPVAPTPVAAAAAPMPAPPAVTF